MINNHSGLIGPAAAVSYDGDYLATDSARIIIVDDDPGLRELLTDFLVGHGLRAEAVDSGAALRARLAQRSYDLIVLDMMMPGEGGLSVLRALPQGKDAPGVIIFSALASEIDSVVALELGADDYVIKPSSPREILARIRSVMRRRNHGAASAEPVGGKVDTPRTQVEIYAFAGWTFNCRMRALHAPDGTSVRLTEGDFLLLDAFLSNPKKVHSRDEMMAHVGKGEGSLRGRTIDVAISRLRRKLLSFDRVEIIRTVRGNGYSFLPEIICS
ncbi:response regulator [Sphingomonas hylomeconis]|uniref:Response regulator n=1 Tax=Sphingomonas hylomeconis TaxID=1395958 RepID=A0ABV7STW9_9SPHN|nr:response regulator [Sphingomonas hylomeconis]